MDVGSNIFLNVSQSSVSRCIKEVVNGLNHPNIFNEFVKFPGNLRDLDTLRRMFYEQYNFPGIIGCIDCTHIAIFPSRVEDPEYPEHLYLNRKGYHSINVQLVCDSNMTIININARYPVSTNDAFIWNNSNLQRSLRRNLHAAGNSDYYLLGDSGYPLRSWLMTPIEEEPAPHSPEFRYSASHKMIRSIIERCNGVLKMRWRCLLKHRVLHYAPDHACKIINACAVLHNLCIHHHLEEPLLQDEDSNYGNIYIEDVGFNWLRKIGYILENLDNFNQADGLIVAGAQRINPELAEGRRVGTRLIRNVFNKLFLFSLIKMV
ncbi:hypothetical protein MML48_9g00013212 [Holotrichia oblita]|uniref:Uncharacterized protein n=1 Tax=Holotrichia oblita TaxID=644536 RepID=A0ACB9SP63_HOLOL|nr:hypothetical protein MML48_9g00013212 [Holotrichia oblita]